MSTTETEMPCRRPDKRRYATRELAEQVAEKMNLRDDTVPAVAYDTCPCGWWHVGRDNAYGLATCAWCGARFRYLLRCVPRGTPPRWCKPTHRKNGKRTKRARLPDDDPRRVDLPTTNPDY